MTGSFSEDPDSRISRSVALLDAWLDTMHSPQGYTGPVPHWWQDCLNYTGPGLDWRYEGIIQGYLTLYEKTSQQLWLDKACRAGDDLIGGQLSSGNYCNSNFEMNPYPGGMPHEAACDLALLRLAITLKGQGILSWEQYASAAGRNLESFLLDSLWDRKQGYFWNDTGDASFTPNKAATIVEALLAWLPFSDERELMDQYIRPTLDAILDCQVRRPRDRLDGAIDQGRGAGQASGRYFPLYIARCIPALVRGYEQTGQLCYLEAAQAASGFLERTRMVDGSFPQVLYANRHSNRYPQWIAGTGDILRAIYILQPYGIELDPRPTLEWLLAGQLASGGVRTAHGFGCRGVIPSRLNLPEYRDLLPACGWVDKAFRVLCSLLPQDCQVSPAILEDMETECLFRGKPACFLETAESIEVRQSSQIMYRWRKGALWAEVYAA